MSDAEFGTRMRYDDQAGVWEHGRVAFSPDGEWLSIGDQRTGLDHRSAALLCTLVEAGGRAVTKDALMARAWAGRVVHENSIAKAVSKLRVLLTGSGLTIVTVHGVGTDWKRRSSPRAGQSRQRRPTRPGKAFRRLPPHQPRSGALVTRGCSPQRSSRRSAWLPG